MLLLFIIPLICQPILKVVLMLYKYWQKYYNETSSVLLHDWLTPFSLFFHLYSPYSPLFSLFHTGHWTHTHTLTSSTVVCCVALGWAHSWAFWWDGNSRKHGYLKNIICTDILSLLLPHYSVTLHLVNATFCLYKLSLSLSLSFYTLFYLLTLTPASLPSV